MQQQDVIESDQRGWIGVPGDLHVSSEGGDVDGDLIEDIGDRSADEMRMESRRDRQHATCLAGGHQIVKGDVPEVLIIADELDDLPGDIDARRLLDALEAGR